MTSAGDAPPVALLTYSTRPRGGPVHTLALGEALHRAGYPVHVFALGDPDVGFFRPTTVPHTIIPAPPRAETLEERVEDAQAAFLDGLAALPLPYPILHAQDCIAARVAGYLREQGRDLTVVRTVHHVDDFTTPALIDCQRRSIVEPDRVLVVSRYWQRRLRQEFGVQTTVVPNGVDARRFAAPPPGDPGALRERIGAEEQFLFLTVGGLEPRKGSLELIEALAKVRDLAGPLRLAVIGGHSFQDHAAYRARVLERADELDLSETLVLLGTVPDGELSTWYHAADAFLFPSVTEGWGLVVLEAMAAGLPVIATDIPVFREYLSHDDALLVPPQDPAALAHAMALVVRDAPLRRRLAQGGPQVAARYPWDASAARHAEIYQRIGG